VRLVARTAHWPQCRACLATSCTAVGEYEKQFRYLCAAGRALERHELGHPVDPSLGTQGGFLSGVSCSSPTSCIAVGLNDNGGVALAEYWNGTSWAVQSTPNPAGTAGSEILRDILLVRHGLHRSRFILR